MKKYKAILFDFDGVIGKTMEDNYKAWKYAFSKYNIKISKTEYFLLEGMSVEKIAEHFLKQNPKKLNLIDKIINLKEKYYLRNSKFSVYPGVKSILPYLKKKGYLLGLVSGGTYRRISMSLKNKFLKFFDVVLTGDKIKKCKPHPESYLTAAQKLNLEPSQCLVVENAPFGIQSAKNAEMYCVAVCSTLNKKYLKKADKIINKITELTKYVSKQ